VISEKSHLPEEDEYSRTYEYGTTGACTIRELWVDGNGSCWLESNDGQRVVVPAEIRNLIAKRVRETKFR
jgi:hypothetical protein